MTVSITIAVVWAVILFSMTDSKNASEEPSASLEILVLIH
jgi:hypothetical protein